MHRALGLLLLATEGALAQSREPSDWDDKVPGYGGTVAGCPCDSTTHVCNHAIYPKVEQKGTSSLEVDYAQQVGYHGDDSSTNEPVQFEQVTGNSKPALKFAYLTDQDGTIIAYNDDWDIGSTKVTFIWDAQVSNQPTGLVPHIVLNESCADLVPSVDVWNTTKQNVPRRFITRSTPISTWRAKLALLTERYDVGNSPSDVASPPSPPSPPPNQPSPPPSPSPMRGFSWGDGTSWFTGGPTGAGKVEATTFPTLADLPDCKNVKDGCTNAAWLTNQDGTILEYEEELMKVPPNGDISKEIEFTDTHFPRGTLDLHACRLFPTKKVCATENIRDKYIEKINNLAINSVGAYSETNTAFTDVFSGHFDKGAGRTSIGPKSNTSCTQYVIYAKKIDDGTDSLLAFAFDKAIHFAANTTYEYEVSLTCDGSTRITGTMDLKVFDAASTPEGTFADVPQPYVVVGDKKCFDDHDDHDGHDHAEGAEEEAAGHPPPPPAYPSSTMENPTWFKHDGRDCICEQGTLKCKRAGAGSPFSMNEGETVGLVIAVSAIVFICIGAIFFFGYSAMLKRKARDTGVVLQSDGDRL